MRVNSLRAFTRGQEDGNKNTKKTTAHEPVHPTSQTLPKCQQFCPSGLQSQGAKCKQRNKNCRLQEKIIWQARLLEAEGDNSPTLARVLSNEAKDKSCLLLRGATSESWAIIAAHKVAKFAAW